MFKSLNDNELMLVNGGFYYVPCYKMDRNGNIVYVGLRQVASGSGIRYYRFEYCRFGGYRWVAHYY